MFVSAAETVVLNVCEPDVTVVNVEISFGVNVAGEFVSETKLLKSGIPAGGVAACDKAT